MVPENTSMRLKKIMAIKNLKQIDILNAAMPYCKQFDKKLSKSDLSQYISGVSTPRQDKLKILSLALDVSPAWLMGFDVPMRETENYSTDIKIPPPNITQNYTTFPVIGEVAAGYDHIACEDWEGDTVDIPNEYLKGRSRDEFFVLRVKGDSMYPTYQDGDKVLVLKQSTLNYSGQVGVVLYDDELGTLKKVEYKMGEDWMKLIPINPAFPPVRIENEELEHCRILGIPRLLIREIEE